MSKTIQSCENSECVCVRARARAHVCVCVHVAKITKICGFTVHVPCIVGSAAYIVREMRSVRERRKWRHLSSAEIGDEFCSFACQKICTSYWRRILHFSLPKISTLVSPLLKVHTFRCQKRCTLRNCSHSSFCFCQMAWQGLKHRNNDPAATSFSSKKWIKLINIKNYWK